MLTSGWTIFLGVVAIFAGTIWYFLDRKIKEEEQENKVEPDLNDLFNEISSVASSPNESAFNVVSPSEAGTQHSTSNDNANINTIEKGVIAKETHIDVDSDKHKKRPYKRIESRLNTFSLDVSSEELKQLDSGFSPIQSPLVDSGTTLFNTRSTTDSFIADNKETSVQGSENNSKKIFHEENDDPSLMKRMKGFFKASPTKAKIFDDTALNMKLPGSSEVKRPDAVTRVALILKAPDEQPYTLHEVLEVANELQLVIGHDQYIDHLTTTLYGEEPMYSIAHLYHPGTFDEAFIAEDYYREIPGLLFFSEIPGPDPEMDTIDYLVKAAAQFGNALGGVLYNDRGEKITKEKLAELYHEIGELDHQEWEKALSKQY